MGKASRALVVAIALALVVPSGALAGVDDTPPVGSVEVVHDDRANELVRLHVPATDDLGTVTTVEVSSNGTTWESFPYAADVDWSVFDPSAGGAPGEGKRVVQVRWTDDSGNTSDPVSTTLIILRAGSLELPDPPVTGQVFTMRPIYPPSYVFDDEEQCTWELRWGNNAALDVYPNETFGSISLIGGPDSMFCREWRVTLPWVPVPQFELVFSSFGVNTEDLDGHHPRVVAAIGSTDRRIHYSNLPMVQLLPNKYVVAVGERVTYTAYPLGTTIRSTDIWGLVGPGGVPYPPKYGGSTFSFVPTSPGTWLGVWSGHVNRPYSIGAAYDPRARKPDNSAPNTTPPVQSLGGATPGPNVPFSLTWSGADQGWGIDRFQLHRSVNGGAWQAVSLPTPKATSIVQSLPPGTNVRYRVRAVDKAGNTGAWDYGPTFRTRLVSDFDPSVVYNPAWSTEGDGTAIGSALHWSSTATNSATLSFVGRDVAWIAEKGPGKGQAKVYIDGVLAATVNLNAGSDTARQLAFKRHWSASASHVIRIVVEGGAAVTLDAFLTLR